MILTIYIISLIAYIWRYILSLKVLHKENWVYIFLLCIFSYLVIVEKKREVYKKIGQVFLICLVLCLFNKDLILNFPKILFEEVKIVIIFGFFLTVYYLYFRRFPKKFGEDLELYEERKGDLKLVQEFIKSDKSNILGIESDFGTGKSFLVDKVFESTNEDEYEVIKIRCLLLEKELVYQYICNKLNKVLIKNNIFSGHGDKIKEVAVKSIESKYLAGISNIFSRVTNIDEIENFKEAISELDKKVIILFDDLDRVNDIEVIDRVFSFISDFSKGNVKTIVLYNLNNLRGINKKYNRYYIEKYIPYTVTLTKLSFKSLLVKSLEKKDDLFYGDFEFLVDYFEGVISYEKSSDIRNLFERLGMKITYTSNITPRKMDIFLKEVSEYFKILKEDIEKRVIIAFCFLKHINYEEFYEKIDIDSEFESIYPIELEIKDLNKTITLEDYQILYSLGYDELEEEKIVGRKYINVCGRRIFLGKRESYSIYLNKIGIEDKNLNLKNIQYNVRKKLEILRFEIKEEDKVKYEIYDILNYSLYTNRKKQDKVLESKDALNKAIKKLKYIGIEEFKSGFKRYYDRIKKILEIKDLKERKEWLKILNKEYYHNGGKFDNVFYMFESQLEKIMVILDTFNDENSKERFLELIYFNGGNKITDEYIEALCKTKLRNIKIYDSFIEDMINKNYDIKLKDSLKIIKKDLKNILSRVYEDFEGQFDDLSNEENYEIQIEMIEEKREYIKDILTDEINKIIDKQVQFLKELIELEKKEDFIKEEKEEMVIHNNFEKYKENSIEEIKADIEKKFEKGISLRSLKEGYNYLKREKKYSRNNDI